jgi:hypothetical protein
MGIYCFLGGLLVFMICFMLWAIFVRTGSMD